MHDTLDIMVNRFDPNRTWIVTPQTITNLGDPDEDPDQTNYEIKDFKVEEDGRYWALLYARHLGEQAVKAGEVKQAVVFLEGSEAFYISPEGTIER